MPFANRSVVKPLNQMTTEMKKFTPSENYETAGVINLDIKSRDEINEIYHGIRDMQIHIVDYLRDMNALQEDKQKAEHDLKDKDEQLVQLSRETYTDTLTGVGSKAAYVKKVEELNEEIQQQRDSLEFAIVMVDMNNLKQINDEYGHKAGDQYLQGCCHMICEAFKHSPVYRIGGDEFVVVLIGQDYADRKAKTDQLKADYEKAYAKTDQSRGSAIRRPSEWPTTHRATGPQSSCSAAPTRQCTRTKRRSRRLTAPKAGSGGIKNAAGRA